MPSHDTISLVVIDDHEVVRQGLLALFETSRISVLGTASSGEEALEICQRQQPAVALLDIRLQDGEDGLASIKPLREACPQMQVVVLTSYDNPTYVARAASAGAADFLLKSVHRDTLIAAVEAAVEGTGPHRKGELGRVTKRLADRTLPEGIDIPLTPRETQVLRLISTGLSNQEIADSLTISVETVKEHVQNLLRKLQVTDRTQAAVWAVRQGFS
ncbi:MAG: DNA-binding response regulator [Planctomycetia bacterium]|jgi:DNA-binding NarL/FixJ family response regulator|nr:DNA-binding response regulator [Planctomycetia bacterium]